MNKQKVITAIYNLQKFLESLEASLYAIKSKEQKHDGHLANAKHQSSNIGLTLKSELSELKDELEREIYDELSASSTEKFLKINNPAEESKQNMKKILNLKQGMVSNAYKAKKAADASKKHPTKEP
jgi:ElaB/YqjD/DUF883 family membrane-anchored ribosome-binding protein